MLHRMLGSYGGVVAQSRSAAAVQRYLGVFRYGARALALAFRTQPVLASWLFALNALAGLLPVALTYTGKLIVDAVVRASTAHQGPELALQFLLLELGLVMAVAAVQRGLTVCESLLRALLAQAVNELILEKALTL